MNEAIKLIIEKLASNELLNKRFHHYIQSYHIVGYPKYNYPRLVDRNPLEVTFYQSRI